MDLTREDRLAHLQVDGGPLTAAVATRLAADAEQLTENRDVRVVLLDARTAPFCSGPAPDLFDDLAAGAATDPAAVIARLRPPVVCVIDGACHSVGLEIALAADIRVCGPAATFALPDILGGRLPSWGGTQRLPRAIRPAEATAMVLTGQELGAERAASLGLVHQVAADASTAAAELVEILLGLGPLSLEMAKEAVHRGSELPLRDGLRLEGDLNHQLAATEDRAEGLQAFFDKRPPDFSGR